MKIMHLMLSCFYIDNYAYQENLIPKFHSADGYEVEIVASTFTFDSSGKGRWETKPSEYISENGIPVSRLAFKFGKIGKKLRCYIGLEDKIEKFQPDILFIHGVQFCAISSVVRYCRKRADVKVYIDNHADFMNSGSNWLSQKVLHGIIWRHYAHKIEPYARKFYGVLPVRVDFLTDVYRLPKKKCELLVMGADDEQVERVLTSNAGDAFRKKYNIKEDEFLIVTGGKIDRVKRTIELIQAIKQISTAKVKLVFFGSIVPELQEQIAGLCDDDKVQYAGWMNTERSYDAFAAADLVVFPGLHSVYWEQAAGIGIPMLVHRLSGVDHIDVGGNIKYIDTGAVEDIYREIMEIVEHPDEYAFMKERAALGRKKFSYREIARRSIEA